MTYAEAIYDIMESVRGHIVSTEDIDIREVKFNLNNQRALWLRNELNKNRTIDPNIIQDLGCVALEYVDAADCCSINIGCKIKRTVLEIPNTIERHSNTTITRVGPINKIQVPFSLIGYDMVPYAGNGRANRTTIFAFQHDKHFWFFQKASTFEFQGLRQINIQGVLENPEDAKPFVNCNGTSCFTDDSEYPLNRWMYNYIKGEILKLYGITAFMPSDTTMEGKHNLEIPPQKREQQQ